MMLGDAADLKERINWVADVLYREGEEDVLFSKGVRDAAGMACKALCDAFDSVETARRRMMNLTGKKKAALCIRFCSASETVTLT